MTSRTPRRAARLRLTLRGWVFLAAGLVALVWAYGTGLRELLYVAILLAALPAGALSWVWWGRPRLSVDRVFSPHVIEAGRTAHVSLTVRNLTASRSRPSRWSDAAPWADTEEAPLPALQPRGSRFASRGNAVTLSYDLRPPSRGVFPIGPLRIDVADALGLATATLDAGEAQHVVVTPQVVPLSDTGISASAGDGEAQLVQRRAAGDDDDAITREYRTGDAMRRVHWRASARHGDLMVRQEEQRSLPEARLIIDTRRDAFPDADPGGESPAFEWAVRMLASASMHLRRGGFVVAVDETGPTQLPELDQRRKGASTDEDFLASLASIELTTATPARRGAPQSTARGGQGPLVAIIGTPDGETLDWLLHQRRGGDVAIAFMISAVTSTDVLDRAFDLRLPTPLVAERLLDAGWLVMDVRDDDDHAAVWNAVVIETGRARAGG